MRCVAIFLDFLLLMNHMNVVAQIPQIQYVGEICTRVYFVAVKINHRLLLGSLAIYSTQGMGYRTAGKPVDNDLNHSSDTEINAKLQSPFFNVFLRSALTFHRRR
jgi:hypothetical protein